MKLTLVAAFVGLALAGALLDLSVEPIRSAIQPITSFTSSTHAPSTTFSGTDRNTRHDSGPASHGDGNRARQEYLNENVINGATTTICAEDADMHKALDTATEAWNRALGNLAGGNILTNHPNSYIQSSLDPLTGLPIERTVTGCRGMDVEVLRRANRSLPSQCDINGWAAAACYDSELKSTPKPRRFFVSEDNDDPGTLDQRYGIIYRAK